MHTLIQTLYQINAIKLGDFTLKSGQHSSIYFDLRQIISYPNILRSVANILWEKISGLTFQHICGVPYTALPIATCLSLQHNIPMLMTRKEKKNYGTKQAVEGVYNQDDICLIIEDVITTGSSILETLNTLTSAGLRTKDVMVLINREQGGQTILSQHGLTLHSVFTQQDIISSLLQSGCLDEKTTHLLSTHSLL